MSDFYVTLPSSVPNPQFKNTSSRYITRLPEVLNLERDKYVVAATDIIYPFSYVNVGKPLNYWIHFKSSRLPIHISFPPAQYSDAKHVVNTLNGEQTRSRLKRAAVDDEIVRIKRAKVEEKDDDIFKEYEMLVDGDNAKGNKENQETGKIMNNTDSDQKTLEEIEKFITDSTKADKLKENLDLQEGENISRVSKLDDQKSLEEIDKFISDSAEADKLKNQKDNEEIREIDKFIADSDKADKLKNQKDNEEIREIDKFISDSDKADKLKNQKDNEEIREIDKFISDSDKADKLKNQKDTEEIMEIDKFIGSSKEKGGTVPKEEKIVGSSDGKPPTSTKESGPTPPKNVKPSKNVDKKLVSAPDNSKPVPPKDTKQTKDVKSVSAPDNSKPIPPKDAKQTKDADKKSVPAPNKFLPPPPHTPPKEVKQPAQPSKNSKVLEPKESPSPNNPLSMALKDEKAVASKETEKKLGTSAVSSKEKHVETSKENTLKPVDKASKKVQQAPQNKKVGVEEDIIDEYEKLASQDPNSKKTDIITEYETMEETPKSTIIDEFESLKKQEEEEEKSRQSNGLQGIIEEFKLLEEAEALHNEALKQYGALASLVLRKSPDETIYHQFLDSFRKTRASLTVETRNTCREFLRFKDVGDQLQVEFLDSNVSFVEFDEPCAYFLGFVDPIVRQSPDRKSQAAQKKIDYFGNVSTIYLYCDVVDPIIVGNTKTSLLSVIPCKGKYGEMIHFTIPHPRYLPLMKATIDSIRVELLTEFSEPIDFNWGSTIIVLHFKKIE